jgi:hypothetical protein
VPPSAWLSDAASAVYERDGNRRAAPDRAFMALDHHLLAKAETNRAEGRQPVGKLVVYPVANSHRNVTDDG